MQPIQIYNAPPGTGPNPWKPALVLEELGVPYEFKWIPYGEIKSEPYISLNPNGRLPSMIDPNTDVTLFESGAIVSYLVSTYDTEHMMSYGDDAPQQKWQCDSWLHVQMSGQGPMFGQKMWFTHFHKDRSSATDSVRERYGNEVKRILGVLDAHLRKQKAKLSAGSDGDGGREVWVVGSKCTYADLMFVPWDVALENMRMMPELEDQDWLERDYPVFWEWHRRVCGREKVRKVLEVREECMRTMENTAAVAIKKQNEN